MSQPVQLAAGLWRLGCYHSAVYLLRGEGGAALIEAGMGATAALALAQLDALGVPREAVERVVVSHGHADHLCGLPGLLAGLPRARVAAGAGVLEPLARPNTARRLWADDDHGSAEVARRDNLPPGLPAPVRRFDLPAQVLTLAPGDQLTLAGQAVRVLSGGGHAPGALCFWLPESGALLAADSAGFSTAGGPAFPMFFVSYELFQQDLAAMAALTPEVVCPGHQQCWHGPDAGWFLATTAMRLAEDRQAIRRAHAAGASPEHLAQRLFRRYYHGELTVYTPENIMYCCGLIVRRSLE